MSQKIGRPFYVIHASQIIDGSGSPPLIDASLLVRESKIQYVGPTSGLPPHEGAEVVDASGLTLMPGLIDGDAGLHGSLRTIGALKRYVQYGVTTIATFQGYVPGQPLVTGLRDAIERGELLGCARLIVGHVVNATNGHNRGRRADGPWEIRRAVREMAELGADFIKTSATGGFVDTADGKGVYTLSYTPEELYALVDEAHAWGLTVNVHAHSQPGINRAIEAGADILLHGCFMDSIGVAKMVTYGTKYIPTLRITSNDNMGAFTAGVLEQKEKANFIHRQGMRMAIEAGVDVLLGSHAPGPASQWKLGESTAVELSELMANGMNPLQAINAGTLRVAQAYGIDHRVGSLETGKEADLIILDGDPTDEPVLLRDPDRVKLVLLKGRVAHATGVYRKYHV